MLNLRTCRVGDLIDIGEERGPDIWMVSAMEPRMIIEKEGARLNLVKIKMLYWIRLPRIKIRRW